MYYNLIFRRVCANVVAMENKYLTGSEFLLVALGILHAMRMRHIIICVLLGSTKFFTLSHERHNIRKKKTLLVSACFDFHYKYCLEHFSF